MELMTAADILQEATLKMAMLYETHPNDAMFSVRDYFSGAEADALVQTGMWMLKKKQIPVSIVPWTWSF